MKLWFDTEFNSFAGALISIGIVDEDGREFYEVAYCQQDIHPWVAQNVMPVLGRHVGEWITIDHLKQRMELFLKSTGLRQAGNGRRPPGRR